MKETKTIRLDPDVLEKIKTIAPEGQLALYIRMLISEDFKKRGLNYAKSKSATGT